MLGTAEYQAFGADTFNSLTVGGIGTGSGSTPANFGLHNLGVKLRTRDGRTFIYTRCGATATVAGSLYQSSAPVAGNLALTPAAAAIGATAITVTMGATSVTQNQYAQGYLQIDTGPGNGYMYGIDSHLAITNAVAGVINLCKDDAIAVALTTASRVGLMANPYADVIVAPTTLTGMVAGVANAVIVAAQYGWLQTWGPCAALINGTPAVTAPVINSATTAGALDVWTAAAQPTSELVGHMMQVGVSGKNNAVFLRLSQ